MFVRTLGGSRRIRYLLKGIGILEKVQKCHIRMTL